MRPSAMKTLHALQKTGDVVQLRHRLLARDILPLSGGNDGHQPETRTAGGDHISVVGHIAALARQAVAGIDKVSEITGSI